MSDPLVVATVEGLDVADVEAADSAACADLLRQARRVRGWLDALEARITARMTTLYETAGAAPAAAEHGRHSGVSAAEGRRKERRSKTIVDAPSFGDALATGAIGAEHVDALANATAACDGAVKAELLASHVELADEAAGMTPEQFTRHCRDRIRELERDQGIERNRRQRRDTYLRRKTNMATGMVDGSLSFHPELADLVFGAIDREVAAMIAEGERRGDAEFVARSFQRNRLAAEALGRLVAGGHQASRPVEADVAVICDHETATTQRLHAHSVCETSDGLALPPASIARLLCNGRVTPVIVGADGVVLDAGRTIRHANRHQRRALRSMYRTCAFAGCDVPFDRCEMHHVHPWELGGPTDLANMLPLCSHHHHVVHEGGWHLHLAPDRTLTITTPLGVVHATLRPDLADAHRARIVHRRRPPAA